MKNVTSYFLMGTGRYAQEKSESVQLRKSDQISGHITHTENFTALAIMIWNDRLAIKSPPPVLRKIPPPEII